MLSRNLTESAFFPLFLMLVLGAGAWWFQAAIAAESTDEILIEPEDLQIIESDFSAATGREANESEKQLLLDGLINDEILLNEGIQMAPWTSDPVVRRRLVQLVSFFDQRDAGTDPGEQAREALRVRAERYEIRIGGEAFDLSDALSTGSE